MFTIASLILFAMFFLLPSGQVTGALSDDVQVHDIDPVGTYEQNITSDGIAQYVFVVQHTAETGNITILLSNTSSSSEFIVETSDDMFVLGPNSSSVVRVNIYPEIYDDGLTTEVSMRILVIRDGESLEIIRNYTVNLPKAEIDGDGDDDEDEGVDIIGFHVDLPGQIDNNVGRFCILFFVWLAFTIIVHFFLDPFVHSFTSKTETEMDDLILDIIRKPIFILIIIYGLIESLDALDPPSEILDVLQRLYGIIFFGTAIYTAYKIFMAALQYMDRLSEKTSLGSKVHHALVPALSKVGSIIFFFIGLNVILGYLGMDLALLMGGMTIMGLVIAFAAQDTLSNFFGGIFLIMEPNFKEKDTIILRDITYNVKQIGMRTTQLYDISNHALVIIPNNILANEKIVTLTEPDRRIKMNIQVGVAYGTDVDLVEDTLLALAKAHPEIMTEPNASPFVRFNSFGDSSLDFTLVFWVQDLDNRFRVKHEIMKRVNNKFEELKIEIPFPQRVVYMMPQDQVTEDEKLSEETKQSDGGVDPFGVEEVSETTAEPEWKPKQKELVPEVPGHSDIEDTDEQTHRDDDLAGGTEDIKLKQVGNVDTDTIGDDGDGNGHGDGGGNGGDGGDDGY